MVATADQRDELLVALQAQKRRTAYQRGPSRGVL
jgi:hypothetical protein